MSSPYLTFWSLHHKLFPYYLQQLFPALLILRINNAHYLPEGTDKFYLSLLGWSLAMMHVIDVLLDSFTRLFRHHRYSPLEKLYSVILFIAGLSLRDVSERFCLTYASRESVLGITYFHETFGNRNKIERWFRELKNRTKRFHSNVNSKTLKSIEEIATAVAIVHNLVMIGGR
jgi:hypothetical protein